MVDDLYTNGKDECEAMKLCLHAQIARLITEYDSIAGFPRGKGLIISVRELLYLANWMAHLIPITLAPWRLKPRR
jgi:hypothetical protein